MIEHSALVAVKRNISHHTIGMTFVALITSLPEFAVSISSSFLGEPDIAIANVVGSNITNITLVLGLSLLLNPSYQKKGAFDAFFMLAVTLLCGFLILDGKVSRIDGLILFLVIFAFIHLMKQKREEIVMEKDNLRSDERSIMRHILISLLGMAGVWIGGWAVIKGVIGFSTYLGITPLAITLTVVALGTSLPELATSLIAVRKEMGEIAVGTLIGSNILNIAFVLGTAAMVRPIAVAGSIISYHLPLMILSALILTILMRKGWMGRFAGFLILLIYLIFLGLIAGGL